MAQLAMPITKKRGVSHSLSQSMIFYIPPRDTLDQGKSLEIHLVRKLKGWSLGSVEKFSRLLKNFLIQEERGWDGENDQTVRSNICVCVLCVFVCVFGRWGWKGLHYWDPMILSGPDWLSCDIIRPMSQRARVNSLLQSAPGPVLHFQTFQREGLSWL